MKETFTATQREIVARKMGYEGPMQGFDEFLMSAPSEAQRYSDITAKFSQKMAKGGVVRRYADGGVVPQGQKKPSEIIKEYSTNVGRQPAEMITLVNTLMKSGDGLIIQEHDTIMVMQKLAPKIVAGYLMTTDEQQVLMNASSSLVEKVKQSGITMMYGFNENEELSLALDYKGAKIVPSDLDQYDWRAVLRKTLNKSLQWI